jgi:hypothetical protein
LSTKNHSNNPTPSSSSSSVQFTSTKAPTAPIQPLPTSCSTSKPLNNIDSNIPQNNNNNNNENNNNENNNNENNTMEIDTPNHGESLNESSITISQNTTQNSMNKTNEQTKKSTKIKDPSKKRGRPRLYEINPTTGKSMKSKPLGGVCSSTSNSSTSSSISHQSIPQFHAPQEISNDNSNFLIPKQILATSNTNHLNQALCPQNDVITNLQATNNNGNNNIFPSPSPSNSTSSFNSIVPPPAPAVAHPPTPSILTTNTNLHNTNTNNHLTNNAQVNFEHHKIIKPELTIPVDESEEKSGQNTDSHPDRSTFVEMEIVEQENEEDYDDEEMPGNQDLNSEKSNDEKENKNMPVKFIELPSKIASKIRPESPKKLPQQQPEHQILTHVIDGYVIKESSKPFPVKQNIKIGKELKCLQCGIVSNSKKNQTFVNEKFCSNSCLKRYNKKSNKTTSAETAINGNFDEEDETSSSSKRFKQSSSISDLNNQNQDDEMNEKSPKKKSCKSCQHKHNNKKYHHHQHHRHTCSSKERYNLSSSFSKSQKDAENNHNEREQNDHSMVMDMSNINHANNNNNNTHFAVPPLPSNNTLFSPQMNNCSKLINHSSPIMNSTLMMNSSLNNDLMMFPCGDPFNWSCDEVFQFVRQVTGPTIAQLFKSEDIDGSALSLMRDDHLLNTMQIKLGPALKILNKFNELKVKYLNNSGPK